ncbi:MAG: esterase, partial [Terriglobia bacterium]
MRLPHVLFSLVAIVLTIPAALCLAQAPKPTRGPLPPWFHPVISPEVHPDRSVTFNFHDPNAQKVSLSLEGSPHPTPMEKGDDGMWTVTIPPLAPNMYGYSFVADGVGLMDPSDPLIKPN